MRSLAPYSAPAFRWVSPVANCLFQFLGGLAAVFVLGILWRRINGAGALATVVSGFILGIAIKLYLNFAAETPPWRLPGIDQLVLLPGSMHRGEFADFPSPG